MLEKGDAPPRRVKLCPVTIVMWLLDRAYDSDIAIDLDKELADMICIAFFILPCPGKYTGFTSNDNNISLNDIYLYLGKRKLPFATTKDAELEAAASCDLHFTTQNNL